MNRSGGYRAAGVDIDAANAANAAITAAVESTYGPQVVAGIGAFGGLYDAAEIAALQRPLLVASTDGVGTKTIVAAMTESWRGIGQDLVNHCVNDILVQGAEPLVFLDYLAAAQLDERRVVAVVEGIAAACRDAGCALLGGETAAMPGVYRDGQMDVAGTIVGIVDHADVPDRRAITPGDAIVALPSSGLHTNGYSLARRALDGLDWSQPRADLGGVSISAALLAVHRSYLHAVRRLRTTGVALHGLVHITGGGVVENLPRVVPPGLGATIRRGAWHEPPIFALMQRHGAIDDAEMFRVFNMGLGFLVIVAATDAERVQGGAIVGSITDDHAEVRIESGGAP